MTSFFSKLNFSSSNEDGETEISAFAPAKRLLCVTGSGTRPLDMLHATADEVIAFDVNPAQNALLALKLAAIERLDHREFLAFLGISDGPRKQQYRHIRDTLSPEMRAYWDARRSLILKGVWHAGKWERVLRWNARFLRLMRGRAIERLMTAETVDEQSDIWDREFDTGALRQALKWLGRKWIWRYVIREPGGAFLPAPEIVAARLATGFSSASKRFLFRDSDFATLIFLGRLSADGALPVHLRAENYRHTQDNLPRIRIVQGDLSDIRAAGVCNVDAFSLSDFGSYTNSAAYAACWNGIIESAAPGAGFCERIFMNDLPLPSPALNEDTGTSVRLTAQDKAIIYRLRVGRIAPP